MFLTIVDAFHVLNILLMPLGGHVVPEKKMFCQRKNPDTTTVCLHDSVKTSL